MNQTRLSSLAIAVLACCALLFAALWIHYTLFSTFLPYDDEGLFLHANHLLLAGEPFYTTIKWPYGPAYPAVTRLIHDTLGIPMTHDWARWLALTGWLSLGLLAGALLLQQRRGSTWALVAAITTVLYLEAYAKEPGHPQGMIASLALLIPLVLGRAGSQQRTWRWFCAGAVAGFILQMKLNAGLFAAGAAALVLASPWRLRRWPRVWPALILACAALFPFLLMRPLLDKPDSLPYALLCAIALLTVTVTLLHSNRSEPQSWFGAGAFALGVLLVSVLLFADSWLRGASPTAILSSLLSYTRSQADFYHFFLPYSPAQLLSALLALACVTVLVSGKATNWRSGMLQASRCIFCALVAYALVIDDPANANALAGWAGPWCWVTLWRGEQSAASSRQSLAALAVWFLMLAYPIPGSQLYFGSFFLIPLAVMCLAELLEDLRWQSAGPAIGATLALGLTALLGWQAFQAGERYHSRTPLALPGAEHLRLGPRQAQRYRELAAELDKSDVALTSSGFNSLYTWSSAQPPAPVLFSHSLRFLDPGQQRQIREGLRAAQRPVVLVNRPHMAELHTTELGRWLQDNFSEVRRIKPYVVLQRRNEP